MSKKYINFDPTKGYPVGLDVYFECCLCRGTLQSLPKHSVACKCRNIIVDVDAGRIAVKDIAQIKAFSDT